MLEKHQTVVIVGATGCGKSTQIPQVSRGLYRENTHTNTVVIVGATGCGKSIQIPQVSGAYTGKTHTKKNNTTFVDPECVCGGGGTVDLDPPLNSQKIVFISNTGPDPLKNHKATKPAFNVGPSLA